jgi:hypothetical protein
LNGYACAWELSTRPDTGKVADVSISSRLDRRAAGFHEENR